MTREDEKAALIALVAPWLPNAQVDDLDIQEECGCYSEWTTDCPRYGVTFQAPRPSGESDRELSTLVGVLEGIVAGAARGWHSFTGCRCCCGDENDPSDKDYSGVRPSIWVRVIPVASA